MALSTAPAEFLSRFNLPVDALDKSGLKWDDLTVIHAAHEKQVPQLEKSARYLVDQLRSVPEVHSLSYRVKAPDHLIAKIVRKRLEDPKFEATYDTYGQVITDLVGIRALHLF